MQLSKDIIIDASIDILDSFGLADMTMRRLATQLGVAPGALYWHFKNKQALIDAIARAFLDPFLSGPVKADFATACLDLRAIMLRHRDGAELLSAALTEVSLREAVEERLTGCLAETTPATAGIASATALHFLLGATVLEQTQQQKLIASFPTADDPEYTAELDSLSSLFDDQFRAGVDLIEKGAAA